MDIALVTIAIFAIALLISRISRFFPFRVCAVCAGVAGTWVALLLFRFFRYEVDDRMLAILMGGSAVGIMFAVDRKLPRGLSLLCKLLIVATGFGAAYALVLEHWVIGFSLVAAILIEVMLARIISRSGQGEGSDGTAVSGRRRDIEERLKNCC
ncbi:MAG: hypothetical protein A3I44_02030 [Candidatus Sungbacteria bacterium RIFCSPLOWO2_02_FULL_51_17]|uniref:Uncharacterized protein n=1 Tax=Candidatus Sungbacteria bacterium RIFCSPHIGHO2_02_FULL_51_29 TaxID=1802273 RepID=A0A1G2KUE2_9BACT|nr:MAG: hypothetical protein A2676_04325 [Candidatus Sungbacteria bacterium RIFCSPHIGHO2_01_FULL_51_22]OHA03026.1 MAG: hypothetical protein A3C16_02790 [Candidatus Sungbacteria bacterium RIFCSPHIGHO2_02_FULL_51_29]OHA04804.1 MAG: hypothetical protein A3B29_03350 [Candidatus Sungbacteria bacterium RIFCSPLOWO2_01_FULL_51_34]OHA11059.1 MAG: hypothetical protein A3I44_02030 [Candidatus Sungbacteria bacterium RIFCSPLOWO2_02_FULL_51_17]